MFEGFPEKRLGRLHVVLCTEHEVELAQLRREIVGELRVAAFPSVASLVLPDAVKRLRLAYPRLEIGLEELEPIDAFGALWAWRTDIALIDDLSIEAGKDSENIELVPLVW